VDGRVKSSSHRKLQLSALALAGTVVVITAVAVGVAARRSGLVTEPDRRPTVQLQGAPQPVVAERALPPWLEARPLEQLLGLARCIERSRGDDVGGAYPRSLADVERLACASSTGYDEHHFVRYTPPRGRADPWRARGFTLEIEAAWDSTDEPVPRDLPATRSYLIDTAGNIHVTSEHRRAVASDPLLPMCEPSRQSGMECQPFLPRQRWGVRPQLPGAFITAARDTVRKGRTLDVTLDFTPFAGIDRLVSYSIAWSAGARPAVHKLTSRQGWPTSGMSAVGFRAKHVYADTGQKIIEAVFTTMGGERYVRQDTLQVTPR
jgi:hypothetical protein